MRKKVSTIIGIALSFACGFALYRIWTPFVSSKIEHRRETESRVAAARIRSGEIVRDAVVKSGLPYPPREIFIRAFKHEATLEAWAREGSEPFKLVAEYPVLFSSGHSGPKRREGDRQVPEGFYRIDRFNPESDFHLSLGLDYPNESDRLLSDHEHPGSDIFIHGKAASIGCLPIGDAAIEQLYLLALDVKRREQMEIAVHIFPARMSGAEWTNFFSVETARDPGLVGFWAQLQAGYDAFERDRRLPKISVAQDGRYRVSSSR